MARKTRFIQLSMITLALVLAGCTIPRMRHMDGMGGHMNQSHMDQAAGGGMAGPQEGSRGNGNMGSDHMDMMRFHHAEIPDEYAGMTNPIVADAESLARGQEAYQAYCTTCHGDGGMGDGPTGKTLDPAPAPIAHTSQMLGDDYLFWRISEGGTHFATAMPAWETALDEETRWDLINYVRTLGTGEMGQGMGRMNGAQFDPAAEAARHAEMAAAGVEQGVISQDEADTFLTVHAAMDAYLAANPDQRGTGNMVDRQTATLAALVEAGTISQEDADIFATVHDQLIEAGLMQ